MTCYYPLTAWKSRDLHETRLTFRREEGLPSTEMKLPCGRCIGCRIDRSKAWAARCIHESSLYDNNCFLTLTYNDENYPKGGSLNSKDIQLFMKRLRKRFSHIKIRFFQCGEYGETTNRPHHHVLLFNFDFPDKKYFSVSNGNKIYVSATLAELWPFGMHSIGEVTYESAAYVCRYILKKISGEPAAEHYNGRKPEFVTMSRRPGIAFDWYQKHKDDIFNHDRCVLKTGTITRPPKYYDKLFEAEAPDRFGTIKEARIARAKASPDNHYTRLETRGKLALKKDKDRKKRSLELDLKSSDE